MLLTHSGRRFLASLTGILFPSSCILCKEDLPLDPMQMHMVKGLCLKCKNRVERLESPQCSLCGAEVPEFSFRSRCLECKRNPRNFSRGTSFLKYTRSLKALIRKAKYHKRFELWRELSKNMDLRNEKLFKNIDVITSIPMTGLELYKREVNASELLAKHLARASKIPYKKLLKKTRNTKPQAHLTRDLRKINLGDAFQVKTDALVRGKRILVVDDIFTTGSTFQAASQSLKQSGARRIHIAALARSGRYANS